MLYQVFAFFWVLAFLSGVLQVSIAGAISNWYFSRDINGYHYDGSPALLAYRFALTKSFGSIVNLQKKKKGTYKESFLELGFRFSCACCCANDQLLVATRQKCKSYQQGCFYTSFVRYLSFLVHPRHRSLHQSFLIYLRW